MHSDKEKEEEGGEEEGISQKGTASGKGSGRSPPPPSPYLSALSMAAVIAATAQGGLQQHDDDDDDDDDDDTTVGGSRALARTPVSRSLCKGASLSRAPFAYWRNPKRAECGGGGGNARICNFQPASPSFYKTSSTLSFSPILLGAIYARM